MERIKLEDVMLDLKSELDRIEPMVKEIKSKKGKIDYLEDFCCGLLNESYDPGLEQKEIKEVINYVCCYHRTLLLKYNLIGLSEK